MNARGIRYLKETLAVLPWARLEECIICGEVKLDVWDEDRRKVKGWKRFACWLCRRCDVRECVKCDSRFLYRKGKNDPKECHDCRPFRPVGSRAKHVYPLAPVRGLLGEPDNGFEDAVKLLEASDG